MARLNSERRRLIKAAKAAGWKFDPHSRKHPRLLPPAESAHPPIYFPGTPSDRRGDRNLAAHLRRVGVDV